MEYSKSNQTKYNQQKSRSELNRKAKQELKKLHSRIHHCQLCANTALQAAHRHKRRWYYDKPDHLLWDKSQVLFLCQECHHKLEYDREKNEQVFQKIRGDDYHP